jgi:hypothetical protein
VVRREAGGRRQRGRHQHGPLPHAGRVTRLGNWLGNACSAFGVRCSVSTALQLFVIVVGTSGFEPPTPTVSSRKIGPEGTDGAESIACRDGGDARDDVANEVANAIRRGDLEGAARRVMAQLGRPRLRVVR